MTNKKKTILFVSNELTYSGAPHSLLRMCKVAAELGYQPVIWSKLEGSFSIEFTRLGFPLEIVPESELYTKKTVNQIRGFDLAICNTVFTSQYAKICGNYIPTVWYIREAAYIPDYVQNNTDLLYILQHSRNLCCVSEYAAKILREYAKHPVSVVRNCVEDERDLATDYIPGSAERIRFVQFGTLEYRKGYDVLVSAFLAMPQEYQQQAELYFAGRQNYSEIPFSDNLFSRIQGRENIHYLGSLEGEEKKIRTLSCMDVVVVASRDESCSLVTLEGAMLSKPLIVTENVGAKYMVNERNGYIVKTDNVDSLKDAMIAMLDRKAMLSEMGRQSREAYERYANMASYKIDLRAMFRKMEQKNTLPFRLRLFFTRLENSSHTRNCAERRKQKKSVF